MNKKTGSFLPKETWLHIFDLATLSPYAFITSDLLPTVPRQNVEMNEMENLLKESTRTACSLALVCKLWKELVIPYLYRTILIRREGTSNLLHRTLSRSAQECTVNPDIRPLGWWTQRLDITKMPYDSQNIGYLVNILGYMPNLAVFTLTAKWSRTTELSTWELVAKLRDECAHSLRVLIFYMSDSSLGPMRDVLRQILSAASNLRVLHCPDIRLSSGKLPMPVAPQLKSLAVSSRSLDDYQDFTDETNHFPSLANLIYIVTSQETAKLSRFLRIHGSTLTSIELRDAEQRDHRPEMSIIKQSCPNLVRLDLHEHITTITTDLHRLPHVAILGLRWQRGQDTAGLRAGLAGFTWSRDLPSLKIIQLLSPEYFDLQANFSVVLRRLSDEGIRVQDPRGFDVGS